MSPARPSSLRRPSASDHTNSPRTSSSTNSQSNNRSPTKKGWSNPLNRPQPTSTSISIPLPSFRPKSPLLPPPPTLPPKPITTSERRVSMNLPRPESTFRPTQRSPRSPPRANREDNYRSRTRDNGYDDLSRSNRYENRKYDDWDEPSHISYQQREKRSRSPVLKYESSSRRRDDDGYDHSRRRDEDYDRKEDRRGDRKRERIKYDDGEYDRSYRDDQRDRDRNRNSDSSRHRGSRDLSRSSEWDDYNNHRGQYDRRGRERNQDENRYRTSSPIRSPLSPPPKKRRSSPEEGETDSISKIKSPSNAPEDGEILDQPPTPEFPPPPILEEYPKVTDSYKPVKIKNRPTRVTSVSLPPEPIAPPPPPPYEAPPPPDFTPPSPPGPPPGLPPPPPPPSASQEKPSPYAPATQFGKKLHRPSPYGPPSNGNEHGNDKNPYTPEAKPIHRKLQEVQGNEDKSQAPSHHTSPILRPVTPHVSKSEANLFKRRTVDEEFEKLERRFAGTKSLLDYDLGAKLGEGTFGVVTKAKELATGKTVALKKLITHNPRDGVSVTTVREIKIIKSLTHPNVVDIMDMVVERKNPNDRSGRGEVFMVFPYMDHDLCGLLNNPDFKMSHSVAKLILKQMLEGIAYIHANNYIHRDIKTANILVDRRGAVKIADFGLARAWTENKLLPAHKAKEYTNMVVTRWYRAPELLLGDKRYGPAIDMWSMGCCLGEMYLRNPILQGESDRDQLYRICARCGPLNQSTFPGWDRLPGFPDSQGHPWDRTPAEMSVLASSKKWSMDRGGADLMMRLLTLNPKKRLTAVKALDHPWFFISPLPATIKDGLISVSSSHEMTSKQRREPVVNNPIRQPAAVRPRAPAPRPPQQMMPPPNQHRHGQGYQNPNQNQNFFPPSGFPPQNVYPQQAYTNSVQHHPPPPQLSSHTHSQYQHHQPSLPYSHSQGFQGNPNSSYYRPPGNSQRMHSEPWNQNRMPSGPYGPGQGQMSNQSHGGHVFSTSGVAVPKPGFTLAGQPSGRMSSMPSGPGLPGGPSGSGGPGGSGTFGVKRGFPDPQDRDREKRLKSGVELPY
ncbi:CMGC/CDK protein kinase [Tremella mesenterica]|uniref:CMGC/CDK protein kinase n=1 Tax=Tremella mesenterica TaxID=5217 RepID=A0A4V1M4S4_TREME|nr:CMGC/CDK protein kinase [Tremella mesenterica]